ncbi:MAG: UDP-N-acetylglucosamine--N-acetylmuramyl-(pentapeptide) pyrophosphoryl-undecaprenol N-acetylglucosamine transferase, partial [Actinobacteria bacterium]|nr:UDP-N-acetylglucosamine--N-acetylmuramyl-(pentapeptide) pyrophosphoryl-undecaprenol N-acetylglucosamine transferase [Actinomycetota bacterium]
AVADALRERGADVTFAGTPARIEAELVPARGYPFVPFAVDGFPRRPSLKLVKALGRAAVAPIACSKIIKDVRPVVVFGGGGYVAGPMLVAARRHAIPSALSEADARLGLANRLAAPLVDRVFLAFPVAGRSGAKYLVTGRPVDRAFIETTRAALEERVIVAFGGSLGAGPINSALRAAYDDGVPAGQRIYLIAGRGKARTMSGPERFEEQEFSTAMPTLLAAADVVVARAGGSVAEVAAAGRAAVLIPWAGAADDHQTLNAASFAAAGAATVISDAQLTAHALRKAIDAIIGDAARQATMEQAMRSLARPNAAQEMADELLRLAEESTR